MPFGIGLGAFGQLGKSQQSDVAVVVSDNLIQLEESADLIQLEESADLIQIEQ